jgi:hypothetical protein
MLIFKDGPIEIWSAGNDWLVFGVTVGGEAVVGCSSLGMAYEVAERWPVSPARPRSQSRRSNLNLTH